MKTNTDPTILPTYLIVPTLNASGARVWSLFEREGARRRIFRSYSRADLVVIREALTNGYGHALADADGSS